MSLLKGPIDDTLQLDEMAANMDEDNLNNFPPSNDKVRIVPGQEDSDEEILDAGLSPSDREIGEGEESLPQEPVRRVPLRTILTILSLTFINLLNYMDRFTVAGR